MAVGKIRNIGGTVSINGSKVEPTDDAVIWQKCAKIYNIYKYNTINDILADTTCLQKLFQSDNANKYLARSTQIFNTILSNTDALTLIGNVSQVKNTIATTEWMSQAVGALGYTSAIKVFTDSNEKSTSDNVASYSTSYGTINFNNGDIAKSSLSKINNILALYDDNVSSTCYTEALGATASWVSHYWYYTFKQKFVLKYLRYCCSGTWTIYNGGASITLSAYDEETETWVTLGTGATNSSNNSPTYINCSDNLKAYSQYRIYIPASTGIVKDQSFYVICSDIKWTGVKPNVV